MSQTTDEDLIEDVLENIVEECVDQKEGEEQQITYDFVLDNNNGSENRISDEVLKYKKEIDRISYLLKEKNLIISKLMIALSNQTQEMINLEKAYHALRQHVIKCKAKPNRL